jgi:hypothetical protein
LLLAYAALALMAVPWMHIGQREQIALIGTFPYAALIAARREGRTVSPLLATLVGIGAAMGFALKQYFLIVPVLLELWLIACAGRRWRPLRPETVALVATGLAYLAALVTLEPDFLTEIVPLLQLAYGGFGAASPRFMFGLFAYVGLAILGFVAAHARALASGKAPFGSAMLVAAAGFAAVYFIQFKGWPYHAIPLIGCASLALAASLAELGTASRPMRLFAPALLLLPLALTAEEVFAGQAPDPDLRSAVSGLPSGTPVGFIAENSAVPWAVVLQHRLRYVPRYNGYWVLGAVERNERAGNPNARLTELGRRIAKQTAADFSCLPPRRIIIARPKRGSWNENALDPLPYFLRNPDFVALLSHYRLVSRTTLETYELVAPPPLPNSPCRPGV